MTTYSNTRMSLVEVVKRTAPDGNLQTIAEVLSERNDIIQDAVWKEGNAPFSNKSVRRASLPSGTWRKLNQGVASEASDTVEVLDVIGILETRSANDVEVIKAFPDPAQARNDEDMAFVEGLSQTMAAAMLYSNAAATPEKFTGLAPRMDALAATANVIGAGGTGSDLTSIFVVTWGPNDVHMAYPINSKAGLETEDLGIVDVLDGSNNPFRAYSTRFVWKAGMVCKNPRAMGRIANIESTGSANIFDEDALITLLNRMTVTPGTRIYCNRTVLTQIQIRAKDKSNVQYGPSEAFGKPVYSFMGIPIRRCDQILITEAALS